MAWHQYFLDHVTIWVGNKSLLYWFGNLYLIPPTNILLSWILKGEFRPAIISSSSKKICTDCSTSCTPVWFVYHANLLSKLHKVILIMCFLEYYWANKQINNTITDISRKFLKGRNSIISKNIFPSSTLILSANVLTCSRTQKQKCSPAKWPLLMNCKVPVATLCPQKILLHRVSCNYQ